MPILSGVVNRLTTIHSRWLATLPGLVVVAVGMFAVATANVVVNPESTVMRPPMVSTAGYGGRPSMQMPTQIMLPETGTMDPILRFFGLGGLVAASTGYAMSRRELMRSVFKRN